MNENFIDLLEVEPVKIEGNIQIAVHLHVYYVDLIPLLVGYLNNIPYMFDLFVSVPVTVKDNVDKSFFLSLVNVNNIIIQRTPNRGRDIAPFLCTFGQNLKDYDYILHVHTKKSPYEMQKKDEWLPFILEHILGSSEDVTKIIHLLSRNFGIIGPPDFELNSKDGWDGNLYYAQNFFNKCGYEVNLKENHAQISFIQGTMFWSKGTCLSGYFDCKLQYDDFPEEPLGQNLSIAHALERMFPLWEQNGKLLLGKVFKGSNELLWIRRLEELKFQRIAFQELVSKSNRKNKTIIFLLCIVNVILIFLLLLFLFIYL